VHGALGSCAAFIGTVTIIPFMPHGWAASAGGFPAMAGNVPFLMKDVVLFAASVYLLRPHAASDDDSKQSRRGTGLGAGSRARWTAPRTEGTPTAEASALPIYSGALGTRRSPSGAGD
jgi:hypothetical protein